MNLPKGTSIRRIKHRLYDLQLPNLPDYLYLSKSAADDLNNILIATDSECRFFPIELIEGGPNERPR